MNITVLEENVDVSHLMFSVVGTTLKVVNALRRIMLEEIAIMAVDTVDFKCNSSIMTDEYLTYRLEMVPFQSYSAKKMSLGTDCECNGATCVKCTVVYNINVTNAYDGLLEVTTNDLQHVPFDTETTDIRPIHYDTPILIVKLEKNQVCQARVVLRKGFGSTHAKWMAATSIGFFEQRHVSIQEEQQKHLTKEQKITIVDKCPMNVFQLNDMEDIIVNKMGMNCTLCGECSYVSRQLNIPKFIEITQIKDYFIFSVRTNATLSPRELLSQAMKVLYVRLDTLLQPVSLDRFMKKPKK